MISISFSTFVILGWIEISQSFHASHIRQIKVVHPESTCTPSIIQTQTRTIIPISPCPIYNPRTALRLSKFDKDTNEDENDKDDDTHQKSINDAVNSFLDTQFFNPDDIILKSESTQNGLDSDDEVGNNNNNPVLLWFAKLVKDDYQTAEAFYAAGFISILVIFTQEMLRMVKYGDAYVPFTKIGSGSLF